MTTATKQKVGFAAGGLLVGALVAWALVSRSFNSTTTVMPPAVGGTSASLATSIVFGNNNPHPVFIFLYGTGSTLNFSSNSNVQVVGPNPVGSGNQYTVTSKTPTQGQTQNFFVNYDTDVTHFYDALAEMPAAETHNIYVGHYTSTKNGNASIVVGDATIFAP